MSCPATGEFLGTKKLQGQSTVAPHAPLTAGPDPPSEPEMWPRHYPLGVGSQKWALSAQTDIRSKNSKIDPLSGPAGGRDGATDPMPYEYELPGSLVPSEIPASGHHGFVKWGHDAKITKIGVIPTRGSPGKGKANGSQDRRQDLGPPSECTT